MAYINIYDDKTDIIIKRQKLVPGDPASDRILFRLRIEMANVRKYMKCHYPHIPLDSIPYTEYDKEAIWATRSQILKADYTNCLGRGIITNIITNSWDKIATTSTLTPKRHKTKSGVSKEKGGNICDHVGDMVFFLKNRFEFNDHVFVVDTVYNSKDNYYKHILQQAESFDILVRHSKDGYSIRSYEKKAEEFLKKYGLTNIVFIAEADTTIEVDGKEVQIFKDLRDNIIDGRIRKITPFPFINQIKKYVTDEKKAIKIVNKLMDVGMITISKNDGDPHNPTSTGVGRPKRLNGKLIELSDNDKDKLNKASLLD